MKHTNILKSGLRQLPHDSLMQKHNTKAIYLNVIIVTFK